MRTPFAPEHLALRDSARRLVEGPLSGLATAAEAGGRPHDEIVERCAQLGIFGLGDVLAEVAVCEELGRLRSGGVVALLLDTMLGADLGVAAAAGPVAVARDVGVQPGETGVTGDIEFLVGGVVATSCVIADAGVLVACDDPGWSAEPLADAHALRGGGVAAVRLRDVPAQPLDVPPAVLARAELREAAAAVGAAQLSFEDASAYAQQREAFGRPIARFQVNRHALADLATRVTAAEALVHDTAWRWSDATDAAAARLYAGSVAVAAADRSLQLHGGYGYTTAFDAQRAWRDARALQVGAPALRRRLDVAVGAAR